MSGIADDDNSDNGLTIFSESNDPNLTSFNENLANWAISFNISQNATTHLLQILKPTVPSVPKDARTLHHTQRKIDIKNVAGGEYFYFGIKYWLSKFLTMVSPNPELKELKLHVNIDGIPIFKSSSSCIWPILGSFKEISDNVFPIAIFCSSSKPNPLTAYLKDFIAELKFLEKSPFEDNNGRKYIIKLDAVICDVPARAFLKCIKSHTAYHSCERCIQKGEWYGKIILPNLSAPLRTDEGFRMQADKKHHIDNTISPFLELSFGMVSSFPLDYMHLVCLGVVKRMINQWVHGSKKKQCLSKTSLTTLSEKLVLFKQHVPKEFSRKPRSILEFKRWKATELRQFLLYTGPVVLKDDVNHYGALDKVSSFPYESYLGRLKKLVRRPQFLCFQIVRSIFEEHLNPTNQVCNENKSVFKKLHTEGPVPLSYRHCLQFKKYNSAKFFASINDCFKVNRKVGVIRNFLQVPNSECNEAYIVFQKYELLQPFFTDPMNSDLLSIFFAEKLSCFNSIFPIADLDCKYVQLPFKNGFVIIPQMHLY
nr:uncharacterized protein LOC124807648 [Hydra vulgaris]